MKIKYVLLAGVVALIAIPGTAGQLLAQGVMASPMLPTPQAGSTHGLFDDPHTAPMFSITLPTHFSAADVDAQPAAQFVK